MRFPAEWYSLPSTADRYPELYRRTDNITTNPIVRATPDQSAHDALVDYLGYKPGVWVANLKNQRLLFIDNITDNFGRNEVIVKYICEYDGTQVPPAYLSTAAEEYNPIVVTKWITKEFVDVDSTNV